MSCRISRTSRASRISRRKQQLLGWSDATPACLLRARTSDSNVYDDDFERLLSENCIYLPLHQHSADRGIQEPRNLHQIREKLLTPRSSLVSFGDAELHEFKLSTRNASEQKLMRSLIRYIFGARNLENESSVPFANFDTILTNGLSVKPHSVPDYYEGSRQAELHPQIKNQIGSMIIPTTILTNPVLPNFFLEVKTCSGAADMAQRQACYDGAYGARAMHALQNYGQAEQGYDNKASTFSATYHAGTGTLQIYAHHVTAPTSPDGQPEYHMTEIDSYALTGNSENFIRGATAFRNVREIAWKLRDRSIQAANLHAQLQPSGIPCFEAAHSQVNWPALGAPSPMDLGHSVQSAHDSGNQMPQLSIETGFPTPRTAYRGVDSCPSSTAGEFETTQLPSAFAISAIQDDNREVFWPFDGPSHGQAPASASMVMGFHADLDTDESDSEEV